VYTSSVLRGAPYAFIKFHLINKKKKKTLFQTKNKKHLSKYTNSPEFCFLLFSFLILECVYVLAEWGDS
jgi:hypothetical protein